MKIPSVVLTSLVLQMLLSGCVTPRDENGRMRAHRGDAASQPKLVSLLGRELPPMPPGEKWTKLEADLAAARAALDDDPDDPDRLIWVGRRLGYLLRMHEAIEVFSEGIRRFPQDGRFYRHRGHRYISIRRFGDAASDLERAAELIEGKPDEIEPDGMPNAENIPLTTTAFNVWYHLGLARYLMGDFEGALVAYRTCMNHTRGLPDNVVAVTDWMYLALRRVGRDERATWLLDRVSPDMKIIENAAYHRRCLMYKGLIDPSELLDAETASSLDVATMGYGLGHWHLVSGDAGKAREVFQRVVAGSNWAAFGFIASEAELARTRRR